MTGQAEPVDGAGLALERRGAVAELILARPTRQNAIARATWSAIALHCRALALDPAVRVVLVRGMGGHFSAGADIAEFERVFADPQAARAYNDLVQDALLCVEELPMPTIARIEGNCIGGGCALAAACDLRLAASDARLGITPARLGLAYALGDIRRLINLVGASAAKDLLFTARIVAAEEAETLGLVDRVVATDRLDETVDAEVARLLALSGNSQRLIKALVGRVLRGQPEEDEASRAMRDEAVAHPDFAEGRSAFLAKRRPRFG